MAGMNEWDVADEIHDMVGEMSVPDYDTTDDGELILYTGIYRWANGSYYWEPENMTMTSTNEEKPE
jgi:hypothetical protein